MLWTITAWFSTQDPQTKKATKCANGRRMFRNRGEIKSYAEKEREREKTKTKTNQVGRTGFIFVADH
jgi:hypothetical protein